jgi:hypothetical protein
MCGIRRLTIHPVPSHPRNVCRPYGWLFLPGKLRSKCVCPSDLKFNYLEAPEVPVVAWWCGFQIEVFFVVAQASQHGPQI